MWILLILLAVQAPAQSLQEKIDSLLGQSPAIQRGFWGAHAVALASGKVLLAHSSTRLFLPASNAKLFTTALALTRLGPDHRMQTRVIASAPVTAAGLLSGDLILMGGGDPSLSGRAFPYQKGVPPGDPLKPLEELAGQLWRGGLRTVTGDIIGDDSAFLYEPYPDGWAVQDLLESYGAPVSALTLHDNSINIQIIPGAGISDPARIRLTPTTGFYAIDSRVTTATVQSIGIDQPPGSQQLRLWGTIPLRGAASIPMAVRDPARYAAFAFREALLRRGIQLHGSIAVRHRLPGAQAPAMDSGPEMAVRHSPPLGDMIRVINKVSQNLHAELLLREIARAMGKPPTRRAALELMKEFLAEAGIAPTELRLEDGSGLSRLALVSPEALTALLRYMHASAHAQAWLDSLPVGGEDGTLSNRFRGAAPARVLAKTGSVAATAALSGYLDNRAGERIAFSIMVNHANTPASNIRQFIDKMILLLAD
jgi:D-alanyl-D-alanine carboxypeptidase/D-alanyl-D-alanine-endopeptidase (penicillin-binding protein 4)